ncbi:MAG TPA: RNA-binding cell elongation regulator Jag/EloR [Fimbriimonas sp.]|nr:RNA-binding cell elongation regulator Jag/EloR [Fimbriimonas sp.]
MQSIELTVKSLEEAPTVAAEQLGVSPKDIKITVLEESKKLFGKVSYKVRAESTVVEKPAPAAKPAAAKAAPAASAAPAAEASAPRKKLGAKKVAEEVAETPVVEEAAKPARTAKPARAAKPAKTEATPAAAEGEAAPAAETEEDNGPEVVATQEDADKLGGILKTLAKKSGLDAQIEVGELQGKYINLSIDGREASFLVGKNGEVLNSLQYLINLIAKQQLSNGVRVTLDGNDYRKKRAEALTNLATKIAEKVIERGEEAVLEALPAFERRVIHKALQEIPGVATYSEGEEPDRRVVIAPAD